MTIDYNIYKYVDLNPIKNKQACDCAVRAIAYVSNLSWEDTYDLLCKIGRVYYDVPCSERIIRTILRHAKWKCHSRPKSIWQLTQLSKNKHKNYLVITEGHTFIIDNGKIIDRQFITPDRDLLYYYDVKNLDLKEITEKICLKRKV